MLYILIDKYQVCFSLVSAEDNKINFIKKKLFWHLILFIISSASLPFQAITVKHLSLNWSLTRIYNEICCLIGCVSTQNIYVNSCSDIPIYSNTNALAVIHSFFCMYTVACVTLCKKKLHEINHFYKHLTCLEMMPFVVRRRERKVLSLLMSY